MHPLLVIFVMLAMLTLACAMFAGYDMGTQKRLNMVHSVGFAVILAVTVYVIIDLEYPRVGLIQMTDPGELLVELRETMK